MAELVYEMVWDCRYCGARKLLGLTHRHCPNCGAQQDPNARYFPPDHEKVAVQNHEFVGADVQCKYCGGASSKRAHNCGQCGAALVEGTAVRAQQAPQPLLAGPPSAPPRRAAWKVVAPIVALLAVGVVVVAVLWKKPQQFVVSARTWQRSITVERLGPSRESTWCAELPSGAAQVSRHRERHGAKQVPDGEDCHQQKQDRGDGTFKEVQVCKPKFRDEPIYEEKCDFVLEKWSKQREALAEGGAADAPRWPEVTLARAGCNVVGCEREGLRSESYKVTLTDQAGEVYGCFLPQNAWSTFTDGRKYNGKLRALVGTLDCSSLVATR